jgi:hypothetical protein
MTWVVVKGGAGRAGPTTAGRWAASPWWCRLASCAGRWTRAGGSWRKGPVRN